MATETLPLVPAKHADFVHYLELHPRESVSDLVKPYNQFDAVVRKIYAQNPHHPAATDNLLNLVPLFDCNGSVDLRIRARDLSSEPEDLKEKYLFPLNNDGGRKSSGFPAVVSTLKRFHSNFSVFSENSLAGLDWRNVVVAGSAVTTSLLPVSKECDDSKRRLRHFYHETFAPASDVDIFLYGLTEDQAVGKIKQVEACVSDSVLSETSTVRTKNAITIVSRYPTRHVQIVLRIYRSIAEILTGFDVDCACAAYDGQQVYLAPRAVGAFVTQVNHVDLSRRSPSYENRLSKYSHRGFEVFWPDLDRSRIDPTIFERSFARTAGVARLLVLEKLPKASDREAYLAQRRGERGRRPTARNARFSKKLQGNLKNEWNDEVPEWAEEDDVSDYHTFTIPYGKMFHARKIEKLLYTKDLLLNAEWNKSNRREVNLHRHPAFFGNAEDVMHDCCGYCPIPSTPEEYQIAETEGKLYVLGEVGFLKDNPGRQEIGSFNPIGGTDWTETAYVGNTEGLCRAIVSHDLDGVKQWLSRGIDVNRRDYTGRTPLQLATMTSTPEVVLYLVDQGARLIARLADGRTALHIAAARGNVEIIRTLLSKSEENAEKEARKEDANKDTLRKKHNDETPRRHDDAELISNPSDSSDANDRSLTTGSFVKVKRQDEHADKLPDDTRNLEPDIYDINVVTWDNHASPLHFAIIKGHVATVEELVSSFGADVLLPIKLLNDYNNSPRAAIPPLVLALQLPKDQARLITVKLLQLGASPSQADLQQKTALHYLAGCMRLELLDDYLRYDQPAVKRAINILNAYDSHFGQTESALMIAIKTGDSVGAIRLIEANADPTCTYSNFVRSVKASGRKILHQTEIDFQERVDQPVILSVMEDQPSVAMALLSRGADPNTLHTDGYDVLNNDYVREYTLGVSLLDCVRGKIKSLRAYGGEKIDVLAPEFLYPDDNVYLERFQEGTYHHWTARIELADAWDGFGREQREYQSEVEREFNRPGKEEKKAAIKGLLLEFENLESELLARGAKGFDEMHPGINAFDMKPRKEEKKYSSFRAPSPSDVRDDEFFELFEAAWRGDVGALKALTLSMHGPERGQSPLEIGITDNHGYTPFAIAVLRGHLEAAKEILAISLAQYKPDDDKENEVYHIQPSDSGSDDEDHSSDDIRLESRVVDPQFTTEDVGEVNVQVESSISPMTVIQSDYPINLFLEKEQRPEENLHSLLEYAIWKDDVKLLLFLLTLGQELVTELSDQPSETIYTVQESQFQLAMRLGRLRCLSELIMRTGTGLPLDKLADNSGIQVKEKPEYYQGLSVRGKKRNDWAAAARGLSILRPVDVHPPLLLAAREGNLDSLEWFLETNPGRCYVEFAKVHRHDKRLMRLAETAQGMERSISNWLDSRHDYVLHCAVLSKVPETSERLIEYLVQNMPHCLEVKSADGYTPLSLAFYLRRFKFAKILVDAGADQTVCDKMGNNIFHLLLRGIHDPDEAELDNFKNMLGLIDPLLVRSLLTERSSLAPGSLTPLALWMNVALPDAEEEREANLRVLRIVLDFAESTDQRHLDLLDGAGNTVVHDAVRRQLTRTTELLIERRPDLLFRENATGSTPLELAEDLWVIEFFSDPPGRGDGSPYIWYNDERKYMAGEAFDSGYGKHPSILVYRQPESFVQNEAGNDDRQLPPTTTKIVFDLCCAKARDVLNRKRRLVTLFEASEVTRRLTQRAKAHIPTGIEGSQDDEGYSLYKQQPPDEIDVWVQELLL